LNATITRLAALLAAVCLTVTLGCDDEGGSAGTSEGQKPRIVVSIPAAGHGWTGGVVSWAEKAAEDFADEADIVVQTATSPDQQISQIETLLVDQPDAMVLLAHESGPLTPVAKRAAERGVYLVNVDRGLTEPVADVYLAGDNAAFGRKSAEFIVDRLGGEGRIVILRGKPTTVDTERYDAAMSVFESHEGIEILDTAVANWKREEALDQMATMLVKHDEIDAVWAQDDDMAEGVEQAIREAGRLDEMWIFGGAGKKEIVKRVMDRDPMYPATITYPPGMIYAGIAAAVAKANGRDLADAAGDMPDYLGITADMLSAADAQGAEGDQKQVTLDVFVVTPDNAERYYFPDSAY
jgi:ribose transport system substrate-binding protein